MTPEAKALGAQPAFPLLRDFHMGDFTGLTKREWLVGMAMQGFIASDPKGPDATPNQIATAHAIAATMVADATLEQLVKETP